MFHYDPGHAARTSRVFAKLDHQIDEWKKRFGPISATEELLIARRSQENLAVPTRPPHKATSAGGQNCEDQSQSDLVAEIQWCRREIDQIHASTKRSTEQATEVLQLKSENAQLRQEFGEVKQRCSLLENAVRDLMRSVSAISVQHTTLAPQAERNVSLSIPELLSFVGSGGFGSLAPMAAPNGKLDDTSAASLRERVSSIEGHLASDASKMDRFVDTITAKVIDALRDELMLLGARPRELQSRVSARVVSEIQNRVPVAATLGPSSSIRETSGERWEFGAPRLRSEENRRASDRNNERSAAYHEEAGQLDTKLATKQQERERREAALMEAERREKEFREAERREAEHREAERREAEHRENKRRENERRDTERREAEHRDAERREIDRLESERLEKARREEDEREAKLQMAKLRDAERLDAERKEAEAERHEVERKNAERRDAERREADQLNRARLEAEADRREVERKNTERQDAERRELERRENEDREAELHKASLLEAEALAAKHREAERRETERLEDASRATTLHDAERRDAERLAGLQLRNDNESSTVQNFDFDDESFEGGVDAQAVQDVEDEDAADDSDDGIALPDGGSVGSTRGATTSSNVETTKTEVPPPQRAVARVSSTRGLANLLSRPFDDDDEFYDDVVASAPSVSVRAKPTVIQATSNPGAPKSSALRDFSDDFDF